MTRTENSAGSGASISLAYKGPILHYIYGALFEPILATTQQKETPVEGLRGRNSRVEVLASRKWLQSTVIQNLAVFRGIEDPSKWRHVKRVTGWARTQYLVISASFISCGLTRHDVSWNFSLLSSFLLSVLLGLDFLFFFPAEWRISLGFCIFFSYI